MEKTEFIIAKAGEEVAEKIINAGLNIQFDGGIVNVNGQKSVMSISGKEHLTSLPHDIFNIRLAELQAAEFPNETEEAKAKREAKTAAYTKFLESVTKATDKLITELEKI